MIDNDDDDDDTIMKIVDLALEGRCKGFKLKWQMFPWRR